LSYYQHIREYSPVEYEHKALQANHVINNSTVLEAVDDFTITALASNAYFFNGMLWFQTNVTADFDFTVDSTSATTGIWDSAARYDTALGTELTIAGLGTTQIQGTAINAYVEQNAAGTITVEWAQATAAMFDTILRKGSFINVYRVGSV